MMATVPRVTSGLGLRKFQADGFLLTRVYININMTSYTRAVQNLHSLFVTLHPPQFMLIYCRYKSNVDRIDTNSKILDLKS